MHEPKIARAANCGNLLHPGIQRCFAEKLVHKVQVNSFDAVDAVVDEATFEIIWDEIYKDVMRQSYE